MKNNLIGLVVFGSLITVTGCILLFFSVNFGLSIAGNWLVKQGGADTETYVIVMEGSIKNFLVAGSILFGMGLATIVVASYKLLHINK